MAETQQQQPQQATPQDAARAASPTPSSSSRVNPEASDKSLRWYIESCDDRLTPRMTRLLVEDCGVPADGVKDHIHKVREQAWEVFPFPCIGLFAFLSLSIARHPRYLDTLGFLSRTVAAYNKSAGHDSLDSIPTTSEAVTALENPDPVAVILKHPNAPRLLDVGTCLGQDVRMLRSSGVPAAVLYGADIMPGFEATGHSLFLDADSFAGRFIHADLFDDSPENPLNQTRGLWDVVTLSLVLHMFDQPSQQKIANRLVRLLRPVKGSRILGTNMGHLEAGDVPVPPPFDAHQKVHYRQNNETMTKTWEAAIVDAYGSNEKENWRVECGYDLKYAAKIDAGAKNTENAFFRGEGTRKLIFSVERLRSETK